MDTTEKLTVYYDSDISGVSVMHLGNSPNENKIVSMFLDKDADRFMSIICNQDIARCAINAIDWEHLDLTGEVRVLRDGSKS